MLLRLEPRAAPSPWLRYGSPLIALGLTLVIGIALFAALGRDPWLALYTFFVLPLTSLYGVSELIVKATPLVLIGVGNIVGSYLSGLLGGHFSKKYLLSGLYFAHPESKYFGVGPVVPWVESGVGAIATQSWANTSYGPAYSGFKLG